ncbi:hypothetical protein ACFT8W_08725 [Streptomyces hygroscopicus]|uniref:hypothetical protein n=1 Tax=Streptomyces hygroscopicus TaxID=1912 RepID=UPI003644E854
MAEFAPQPIARVGIDCEGGMELSLFERGLSALACSRTETLAAPRSRTRATLASGQVILFFLFFL